jgi:glutathione S-transferase
VCSSDLHELIELDLSKGAHKKPEFLAINPFGQVPVLQDGDTVISDSNAILVYLAKKQGATDWLPEDPAGAAKVQRWLSVAAGQIAFGPAAARLVTLFGAPFNADEVINRAHAILGLMEAHLKTQDWLAADHPTIADISLYSYVARAPEGNVDLAPYGKVRDWLSRIEELPGFVPFMHAPAEMLASA